LPTAVSEEMSQQAECLQALVLAFKVDAASTETVTPSNISLTATTPQSSTTNGPEECWSDYDQMEIMLSSVE